MNVNIEAERARRQLTKEALSSALGITSKAYGKYIRGETPIPSDVLISMAGLFQCSADYLDLVCYADGCVKVSVNGKCFNMFDTKTGKFFSGSPGDEPSRA